MTPARHPRLPPASPDLPDRLDRAPEEPEAGVGWSGMRLTSATLIPDAARGLGLTECRCEGVDFKGRRLEGLRCRDAVFFDCDLAGALLTGADLSRVRFVDCRLTGTVFAEAELADVTIEGGTANLANFSYATVSCLWASRTSLTEADFYRAQLRSVALTDSDLTSANFDAATVSGLSLHGSALDGIGGAGAFTGAEVTIDPHQLVTLGAAVLADMGVKVAEPPAALER